MKRLSSLLQPLLEKPAANWIISTLLALGIVAPLLLALLLWQQIDLATRFAVAPATTILLALAVAAVIGAYILRRRHAEAKLRRSQEQQRLLIESVSDVIWVLDVESNCFRFVTPSVATLRGFTPEEVMGQQIQETLAPESAAQVRTWLEERLPAFQQGHNKTYVDEVAQLRRDGSHVWTETTTRFGIHPRTKHLEVYGVSRDITERKRMQAALEEKQNLQAAQFSVNRILAQSPELDEALDQVLQSLAAGLNWQVAELWWCSQECSRLVWRTGWCEPQYTELVNFLKVSAENFFVPGEGLIGTVWQQQQALWIPNLATNSHYKHQTFAAAAGLHCVAAVPLSVGEQALGVMAFSDQRIHPVNSELLAALVDIGRQIGQFSARKQVELELIQERTLLARHVEERTIDLSRANHKLASALHAKDEFLANMSHELRTPLNNVLTMAESLQEGTYGGLNMRQQRAVGLMEQSGQHLLSLINDILDLSKVEAGKLEIQPHLADVNKVCRESLALVQETAARQQVQIAFNCPGQVMQIYADPLRLKQILVNLLSNAIKFTPSGGNVALEVKTDAAAHKIYFSVQDDGIGIAPDQQAKLFEPFTQLNEGLARTYAGTGLGLALVRQLVELHGGRISVQSSGVSGEGSRFYFFLPWEPVETQQPGTVSPSHPQGGQKDKQTSLVEPARLPPVESQGKILIADDNQLNTLALEDFLTGAGYELLFAADGEEVLKLATEVQPDLILMDIQMPKVSGLEAIQQLRSDPRFAMTPILALTALAMPGDRERCLAAGANAYLSKPFRLKELTAAINVWLNHK